MLDGFLKGFAAGGVHDADHDQNDGQSHATVPLPAEGGRGGMVGNAGKPGNAV